MKIELDKIDKESFMVHESTCYGEPLFLVQPQHIGCKWTQENKIFRSSVWNAQGELVSAGFPKFPNWGEQPEVFPVPTSLKKCVCVEKLDGSLLIISKYKGQLIVRTRGTFDAFAHENGTELREFITHLETKKWLPDSTSTWEKSFLFEWYSPSNRIVLNYGDKPKWFFVGEVNHWDYSLVEQDGLEWLSKSLEISRPQSYSFDSIEDLTKIVGEWKGKEGVVIYSKDGQALHKVKGAWYLAIHRMKSEFSNIENIVDFYLIQDMPTYEAFRDILVEMVDWELFNQVQGDISRICEAKKNADNIVAHMKSLIPSLQAKTRKEAALEILSSYGQTAKRGIMFNLLDNKALDNKAWKTLIMQGI